MAPKTLTLAEKILIARNRLGENQTTFANRIGVRRFAVKEWEKGKTPNPEHREKLTEIIAQMLGDRGDDAYETVSYQLILPFDEPVSFELRISPRNETTVHFAVDARRRKAG